MRCIVNIHSAVNDSCVTHVKHEIMLRQYIRGSSHIMNSEIKIHLESSSALLALSVRVLEVFIRWHIGSTVSSCSFPPEHNGIELQIQQVSHSTYATLNINLVSNRNTLHNWHGFVTITASLILSLFINSIICAVSRECCIVKFSHGA